MIYEILKDFVGTLELIYSLLDLAFVSEREQLGAMLATLNKSKLNYSCEVLEKATNYFHNSNKLGQGGSISVYKVILSFLFTTVHPWCGGHSISIILVGSRGKGRGLSLEEGVSHTYILRLGQNRNSIL